MRIAAIGKGRALAVPMKTLLASTSCALALCVACESGSVVTRFPCLEPEPIGSGLYRCQGGFVHRPTADACTAPEPVEACMVRGPACTSDGDCPTGLLCISLVNQPFHYPDRISDLSYSCQKPEDECAGDEHCEPGEHCLLGHDETPWRLCLTWDGPVSEFPGL